MKYYLTTFLAIFCFVTVASAAKKDKSKSFIGTVTYSISYESDKITDVQKASLPSTTSIKMYNGARRFEMNYGPVVQTMISNPTTDKNIVLIDFGDKKAAVVEKYSETQNDSNRSFTTKIDYSSDTKMIAGYECKKATVTFTPKENVDTEEKMYNVYYSSQLGDTLDNKNTPYEGINGLLLEYYTVTPDITTKQTATEVVKGKVKDLDFLMPTGYKEFTSEEDLKSYIMGQ